MGARHTRSGFLARVASRYLSEDAPQDNTTPTTDSLRKVLQKTRGFTDALQKLDIFSEIEAGLENAPGVMNDEQDVDLVVKVRESGKYFLKTASDVGDGEGSAVCGAFRIAHDARLMPRASPSQREYAILSEAQRH